MGGTRRAPAPRRRDGAHPDEHAARHLQSRPGHAQVSRHPQPGGSRRRVYDRRLRRGALGLAPSAHSLSHRAMKARPHPGLTGELQFVVETKHAIDFAEGGMPAVLSTPNLIGLLERTARMALAPLLEANERTVGIEIE